MTVRIDELSTEVVAPPESEAPEDTEDRRFAELEKLRKMKRFLECLERRTRAEGFDD